MFLTEDCLDSDPLEYCYLENLDNGVIDITNSDQEESVPVGFEDDLSNAYYFDVMDTSHMEETVNDNTRSRAQDPYYESDEELSPLEDFYLWTIWRPIQNLDTWQNSLIHFSELNLPQSLLQRNP
jgi:hypothetical protein